MNRISVGGSTLCHAPLRNLRAPPSEIASPLRNLCHSPSNLRPAPMRLACPLTKLASSPFETCARPPRNLCPPDTTLVDINLWKMPTGVVSTSARGVAHNIVFYIRLSKIRRVKIWGLAKWRPHGWIRTKILGRIVWSRFSGLSRRQYVAATFCPLDENSKNDQKTTKLQKGGQVEKKNNLRIK